MIKTLLSVQGTKVPSVREQDRPTCTQLRFLMPKLRFLMQQQRSCVLQLTQHNQIKEKKKKTAQILPLGSQSSKYLLFDPLMKSFSTKPQNKTFIRQRATAAFISAEMQQEAKSTIKGVEDKSVYFLTDFSRSFVGLTEENLKRVKQEKRGRAQPFKNGTVKHSWI